MQATRGYITAVVPALLAFGFLTFNASAKATTSTDIIIQLRVTGDIEALRRIRSCLTEKLSQMPDVRLLLHRPLGRASLSTLSLPRMRIDRYPRVLWWRRSFL